MSLFGLSSCNNTTLAWRLVTNPHMCFSPCMMPHLLLLIGLLWPCLQCSMIPNPVTANPLRTEGPSLFAKSDIVRQVVRPISPPPPPPTLDLRVQGCCGLNCVTYTSIQQMVGLQCCATTPVNYFDKICCRGISSERKVGIRYFDRCCGVTPYSWDQTCCEEKVFEGVSMACCGGTPYSLYDRSKICCSGKLYDIEDNITTAACCGTQMYDAWGGKEFCCGAQVYSNDKYDGCCVGYTNSSIVRGYNSETQLCCDGVFNRVKYDSCCYVDDPLATDEFAPPKPVAYNTSVFCCSFEGVRRKLASGFCPSNLPLSPLAPPISSPTLPPLPPPPG